jgi:plastocyanin
MRALAAAYFLVAALAMPALLWAADDPPADPATATTPATTPTTAAVPTTATAPAPASSEPAPTASTKEDAAPERLEVADDVHPAPKARAAASTAVPIKGFAFKPSTVTVKEGDTVTWTNQDTAPHTATASDGSFDTGNLKKGASGSHKFSEAGTFAYICAIHPNMKGKVVVQAASTGSDNSSSSGSGSSDSGSSDSSSDSFNLDDSSGSDSGSDSPSLANTGGDAVMIGLLGLLLLGAGALARRAGRDKRSEG